MRNQLKIIVATILLFISTNAFSQFSIFKIPVNISYEAGFANQLRHGKEFSNLNVHGIRMAALAEFQIKNAFTLQTGAIYLWSQAERTQQFPSSGAYYTKSSGHQIDVPVYAGYSLPLFGDFRLFGFAGPSLRIGLAENRLNAFVDLSDYIADRIIDGVYTAEGTSELYSNKELKRVSLLFGAGGGVQWKDFFVKGGYDFGLTNINNIDTRRLVQGGWYVVGGYRF